MGAPPNDFPIRTAGLAGYPDPEPEPGPRPSPPRRPWRASAVVAAFALAVSSVAVGVALGDAGRGELVDRARMTEVDFANITVRLPDGTGGVVEYDMSDGRFAEADARDPNVGYHLVDGPVFSDADGDGDLDAAVLFSWIPAAGSPTYDVVVWRWTDDGPEQIATPSRTPYGGRIGDLRVADGGFAMTVSYQLFDWSEVEEEMTIGVVDDDLAQIAPVFGATDRCMTTADEHPFGTILPDTTVRIAPRDDAAEIGTADEFAAATTVDEDYDGDGWVIVELMTDDRRIVCGHAPVSSVVE